MIANQLVAPISWAGIAKSLVKMPSTEAVLIIQASLSSPAEQATKTISTTCHTSPVNAYLGVRAPMIPRTPVRSIRMARGSVELHQRSTCLKPSSIRIPCWGRYRSPHSGRLLIRTTRSAVLSQSTFT